MVKLAERITRQNNQSGINGMVHQFNRSLNTLSVCFSKCLNALDQQQAGAKAPINRNHFVFSERPGRG